MVTPHQQHVFYRTTSGAIHQLFWDEQLRRVVREDWTALAGAPAASGGPATMLTPHQQHVFYVRADGGIHHILEDDRTKPLTRFHDTWRAGTHDKPKALGVPAAMMTRL